MASASPSSRSFSQFRGDRDRAIRQPVVANGGRWDRRGEGGFPRSWPLISFFRRHASDLWSPNLGADLAMA